MIVDFRVIPPLPGTLKSFLGPEREGFRYGQMYPQGKKVVGALPIKPSVKEKWLGGTAGRLLDLDVRGMRDEEEKT